MAEPDNSQVLQPEERSAALQHAVTLAAVLRPLKRPVQETILRSVRWQLGIGIEENGSPPGT